MRASPSSSSLRRGRTKKAVGSSVAADSLKVVNVHDAKTQLSRLLSRVECGERITIARAGKPVAQLVPAPKLKRRRLPQDDPLLRSDEWSFDGPVGKLTNAEIDRIVYGI